jgi:hypothetical protein
VYPIAITRRARRDAADAFVAFAAGEGRAVFEQRGFIVV